MVESISPDAGDAIWNGDRRQALAVIEGFLPDAGDSLTFDRRRNG